MKSKMTVTTLTTGQTKWNNVFKQVRQRLVGAPSPDLIAKLGLSVDSTGFRSARRSAFAAARPPLSSSWAARDFLCPGRPLGALTVPSSRRM
jgi:hypothetical protein